MNYLIECPVCHTRYTILLSLLKISDGQLRCHSCQQVFDGYAALRLAEEQSISDTLPEPVHDLGHVLRQPYGDQCAVTVIQHLLHDKHTTGNHDTDLYDYLNDLEREQPLFRDNPFI